MNAVPYERKTKPLAWVSTVDPSGHFDYSHAHIYQSNIDDYFVAESPTMVIFSLIFFKRFKKGLTHYIVLVCVAKFYVFCQ